MKSYVIEYKKFMHTLDKTASGLDPVKEDTVGTQDGTGLEKFVASEQAAENVPEYRPNIDLSTVPPEQLFMALAGNPSNFSRLAKLLASRAVKIRRPF